MNETARDERTRSERETVAGIGLTLAAIAMAGMAVPVRQGVDDPAVQVGLACSLLVVAVFAGRRYDWLERRYSLIGVVASFAVVALAGFALNQGITATVSLAGVTVPTVFVAFLASGVAIGISAAEYGEVTLLGLGRQLTLTTQLSFVAVVAWVTAAFVGVLFIQAGLGIWSDLSENQLRVANQIGFAVATGGIAVGYVYATGRDWSFFDLRRPTLREIGWVAAGIVLIFLANIAISQLFASSGVEGAEHTATQDVAQNPQLLYVVIPASILIVGPFEELFYRNVVQKSMYDVFSPVGALLVSSVIFAGVHYVAYALSGAGFGAVLASLAVVFGLSLVLGTVYLRTGNLFVPAIIHGLYNAIVFASVVL